MITYLLPTRNRPRQLERTLAAIGRLDAAPHAEAGGAEVVVVDNASEPPALGSSTLGLSTLENGLPVNVLRLDRNEWAAGRNAGAEIARGDWLVMLDDDSHPLEASYLRRLADLPADVAAVGADITLPDGSREAGGLPEVFVGCGAAIRRDVFVALGGYDPSFEYYVEEYDFCAKLLLAGHRVIHDTRFRVHHEKTTAGRDFNAILRRLLRNNMRVIERYAPHSYRGQHRAETQRRYRRIAAKEDALPGFHAGLRDLEARPDATPPRTMDEALYDRFTGRTAVADTLAARRDAITDRAVAVVDWGKNRQIVHDVIERMGGHVVNDPDAADTHVIGTLSPGPMLDAFDRAEHAGRPALMPWRPVGATRGSGTAPRQPHARKN